MHRARNIKRALLAALAGSLVVASSAAIATQVKTGAFAGPGCQPNVQVITFRGSGEGKSADAKSNGWSGPTLQRVIDKARELNLGSVSFANKTVVGVPYPAISLDAYANKQADLFDSIEYGRVQGLRTVNDALVVCDQTKFVLAGYSQGLIVAREVAMEAPKGSVIGVFGMGDPAKKPDGSGVIGTGRGGQGVFRAIVGSSVDKFYDSKIKYQSYCHAGDPVCAFKNFSDLLTSPFHSDYGADYGELIGMAVNLAAMSYLTPLPPVATQNPPPTRDNVYSVMNLPRGGLDLFYNPVSSDAFYSPAQNSVRAGERVRLSCYVPNARNISGNRLWYLAYNVTRPKNAWNQETSGYINAHYVDDKQPYNVPAPGVKQC